MQYLGHVRWPINADAVYIPAPLYCSPNRKCQSIKLVSTSMKNGNGAKIVKT